MISCQIYLCQINQGTEGKLFAPSDCFEEKDHCAIPQRLCAYHHNRYCWSATVRCEYDRNPLRIGWL